VDRYYRALYSLLLSEQVSCMSSLIFCVRKLKFACLGVFEKQKHALFEPDIPKFEEGQERQEVWSTRIHWCTASYYPFYRIAAFVKRLSICATQSSAAIAAGLLLLISEIGKSNDSSHELVTELTEGVVRVNTEQPEAMSEGSDDAALRCIFDAYDASKRDPMFALPQAAENASGVYLWELNLLLHHFHPSVRALAKSLMGADTGAPHTISFAGDPIVEFSLTAFLNRLSYKNAKKRESNNEGGKSADLPVNLNPQLTGAVETGAPVAPDKVFFHKYFGARTHLLEAGRSRDRSRNKHRADDGDAEGDDEEEAMDRYADTLAENLMRSNQPDDDDFSVGDVDDDDSDDDGGDFDAGVDDNSDGMDEDGDSDGPSAKNDMSMFAEKEDSDSDEDGGYALQTYGDDDETSDNDNAVDAPSMQRNSSARSKKRSEKFSGKKKSNKRTRM
jgi:hypothetical protein